MATQVEEHDAILLQLAQRAQGLDGMLDMIFSFFERRTDLFHVMQDKNSRMGFPPGVSEKMV